jgi:hypothetical protein
MSDQSHPTAGIPAVTCAQRPAGPQPGHGWIWVSEPRPSGSCTKSVLLIRGRHRDWTVFKTLDGIVGALSVWVQRS